MHLNDRHAIDALFRHLHHTAPQAGPQDPEAEAHIQQHLNAAPPGMLSHMAQTLVGHVHALHHANTQLAAQQSGYSPYGQPPEAYQPPAAWQEPGGSSHMLQVRPS